MACWELGLQLKRDWQPELEKVGAKLLIVGVGTSESAKEFADQVGLSPELVFGDADAAAYKAARFVNSDFEEDGRKRGMRMMSEKGTAAIKSRANGRNVNFFGLFDIPFLATNDDLEQATKIYKPLLPQGEKSFDLTLVQGGVLVFNGNQEVFKHRDTSVGVHADLQRVLASLTD
mmetsp:Transcript_1187/g.2508  ORF Transcript_1187/g.2508 Transcript_1187/m.2508 type:complete len:175 (+) Transcript_1187:366-890(+)